jgi:hypothetical protein
MTLAWLNSEGGTDLLSKGKQASRRPIVNFKEISSAAGVRRLAASVLVCGSAVGVASIDLATVPASGASLPRPRAAALKAEELNQTMVMNIASIQGNTITAYGQEVTGQINGVVSFKLTLQNGSRATSSFTISNNGHVGRQHRKGTVRGASDGNFHVSGAVSSFKGGVSNIRGTEEFSHAENLGISASGTLNRRTYKLIVTLKGKFIE